MTVDKMRLLLAGQQQCSTAQIKAPVSWVVAQLEKRSARSS